MSDNELIRSVLGESYIEVGVASVYVDDDIQGGCEVGVSINNGSGGTVPKVKGSGVGMVDAMFSAFKSYFATEYESLDSIELQDFKVVLTKGKPAGYHLSNVPGTDAYCQAQLTIKNSYGRHFNFSSVSCSLAAATALGVAQAVEHFMNAERAYVALHAALKDAKERNRIDLITRYTREMSEVVKCTSYASVLARIQKEL